MVLDFIHLGFNIFLIVHRLKPAPGWQGHIELEGEL